MERENLREIEQIRQMKLDYPNMPVSLIAKLNRWERVLRGDVKATIEQTIALGMATEEDFDFTKEKWFKDE